MIFCRHVFRIICSAVFFIYFMLGIGVYNVAAEDMGSANIRTVTRNEGIFDAEYPMVYAVESAGAQESINEDIDRYVQQFYRDVEETGIKEKMRYQIYKNSNNILSIVLKVEKVSAGRQALKTYGLNYNLETGKLLSLNNYYNKESVLNRAQDGLKYVYKIEKEKNVLYPDNYYIDTDDNIIAIYKAGVVADQALGEFEVNLTAADETRGKEVTSNTLQEKMEEGTIEGTEVRFRQYPGMNTKIIDVLKDGESVRLGKQQMADGLSWTYTARKNGSTGWVATQYCKKTGEDMILSKGSRGIITGEDVRLRSEASLNADIMDLFTKGENVEILQSMNANERDWYKVKRSNGSEGWVASEYCRITK